MASKCISVLGMCCKRTCTQITASKLFSVSVIRFTHKYPPGSAPPLKPSRYMAIYRDLHGAIEEPTAAKDFVYALDKKERDLLRTELENVEKLEQQAEGKLGAVSWSMIMEFPGLIHLYVCFVS